MEFGELLKSMVTSLQINDKGDKFANAVECKAELGEQAPQDCLSQACNPSEFK